MLTENVKKYIEKYSDLIEEDLQEFIDKFFKSGYTLEDGECFFQVLDTLNLYTDIDKAIQTTQDRLAHDAKIIAQKYGLQNIISVGVMEHDHILHNKQDIIDARTFGNISLGTYVLNSGLPGGRWLRIGLSAAYITNLLSADVKIKCPRNSIDSLNYFYKYITYCLPYLHKFETFCKKLAQEINKK